LFLEVQPQDIDGSDLIMAEFAADDVAKLNKNGVEDDANHHGNQNKRMLLKMGRSHKRPYWRNKGGKHQSQRRTPNPTSKHKPHSPSRHFSS
jgi:hypothetical protein